MGAKSTSTVESELARKTCLYLAHLNELKGLDSSGRGLEKLSGRSRSYIQRIMLSEKAMNTNDVEIFAKVFDMTPYEFIANARALRDDRINTDNVTQGPWQRSDGDIRLVATKDDNKSGNIDGDHTDG